MVAELVRSQGRRSAPRIMEGTPPCFSSKARYEIVVGGRKLIGSAQRRMRGMMLQQGSLLIGPSHKRIIEVLRPESGDQAARFRRALDEGTTCLREWLDDPVLFEELAGALQQGMAEVLGVHMEPMALGDEEQTQAALLVRTKYGTEDWTLGRRLCHGTAQAREK